MSDSYQNRLKEIKELKDKLWKLETAHNTVVYDSKMMQQDYSKMLEEWEKIVEKSEHRLLLARLWFVSYVVAVFLLIVSPS